MATSFGDFEITGKLLGKGGMASVWVGVQKSLGVPRAIKLLHPAFVDDQEFISRFEQEARHGAQLSHHPNVVTIFAYGSSEGRYFIAMELVDGMDLKTVLEVHRPLPPEIVLLLLEEVAKGLDAAHRLEIWHRDIKPSNILLSRSGEVKVGDFGLARNNRDRDRLVREGRTLPGTVMGTLAYMSPEQHSGWDDTKIDHRTDMFSLGVMAYELLTGERPFSGTESEIRERIMNEDPDPIVARCPLVTPEIENLVFKLMAKHREERYGSMREVVMAIRQGMRSIDPLEDILKDRGDYLRDFAENPQIFSATLRLRNIQKSLERGLRLMALGPEHFEGAVLAFLRVLILDPENREAQHALNKLKETSQEMATLIDQTRVNTSWAVGALPKVTPETAPTVKEPPSTRTKKPERKRIPLPWLAGGALGFAALILLLVTRPWSGGGNPQAQTAPISGPIPLVVQSDPQGARVALRASGGGDWNTPVGTTNCTVNILQPGDWELRFEKAGYRDTTLSLAVTASPAPVTVLLSKLATEVVQAVEPPAPVSTPQTLTGRLRVETNPRGAKVSLRGPDDNRYALQSGVTPLTTGPLTTGTWRLRVTLKDFKTADRTVEIEADRTRTVPIDLERVEAVADASFPKSGELPPDQASSKPEPTKTMTPGTLVVEVHPASDLLLDGVVVERGVEGKREISASPGEAHTLEIRSPLGKKVLPDLRVAPAGTTDAGIVDFRGTGAVRISTEGVGRLDLEIDGGKRSGCSKTPCLTSLNAGSHSVRASSLGSVLKSVRVLRGDQVIASATGSGQAGGSLEVSFEVTPGTEVRVIFVIDSGS